MNLKSSDAAKSPKTQTPADKGLGYCLIYSFPQEKRLRRSGHVEEKRPLAAAFALVPLLLVAACASAPTTRSGSLTSYEGLAPSDGVQTKSRLLVNKENVLAAKTVRIAPTRFARDIGSDLSDKDRELVVNRVDRALCKGLSKRLDVVDPNDPADLSVQATITHLKTTNRLAAGASVIVGFVPSALTSVPLMSPRVPFGLGSLTIEAEALNREGTQDAAIIWSRGASYVMSSTTVSEVGDAYQLASDFGGNFSELVTSGETPFGGMPRLELPKFGGKKDVDCDAYGKGGGVIGFFADNLGAPPDWTDKGAQKVTEPKGEAPDRVDP
jgi:hypothetical protein